MIPMTRIAWLGPAVVTLVVTSCQPAFSTGADASDQPTPPGSRSMVPAAPCEPGQPTFVEQLDAALPERGAYVSNLYVAPATDVADPTLGLTDPWWAAGKVNGMGVRPEAGIWLWDRAADGTAAVILSANASASRYFGFQAADASLADSSATAAALLDCVGPMPEP